MNEIFKDSILGIDIKNYEIVNNAFFNICTIKFVQTKYIKKLYDLYLLKNLNSIYNSKKSFFTYYKLFIFCLN